MSTKRFDELAVLDKGVHEPARLAILTALSACRAATFPFLQALTGLTQGNLSVHLRTLEERGFVELERGFSGHYRSTEVSITKPGLAAIRAHWEQLEALRHAAADIETPRLVPLLVGRTRR